MSAPDQRAATRDGYHRWNEGTDLEHGSFEVFWIHPKEWFGYQDNDEEESLPAGWYWWACFPCCLPDGEPNGPHDTSTQAFSDSQNED